MTNVSSGRLNHQSRPALLTAALTVLRGYIVAGRPDQKLKPWGSFEGWSDLVRNAIVWSGLVDPGETRTELRQTSDSEAGALRQMLMAVRKLDPDAHGLRAADMLKIAKLLDRSYTALDAELLSDAIEVFCGNAIAKTTAQRLGTRLSHFRNRVMDQMALNFNVKSGASYWFVQVNGGPGGPSGRGGPLQLDLSVCDSIDVESTHNDGRIAAADGITSTKSTTSTSPIPDIGWLNQSHL